MLNDNVAWIPFKPTPIKGGEMHSWGLNNLRSADSMKIRSATPRGVLKLFIKGVLVEGRGLIMTEWHGIAQEPVTGIELQPGDATIKHRSGCNTDRFEESLNLRGSWRALDESDIVSNSGHNMKFPNLLRLRVGKRNIGLCQVGSSKHFDFYFVNSSEFTMDAVGFDYAPDHLTNKSSILVMPFGIDFGKVQGTVSMHADTEVGNLISSVVASSICGRDDAFVDMGLGGMAFRPGEQHSIGTLSSHNEVQLFPEIPIKDQLPLGPLWDSVQEPVSNGTCTLD